MNFDEIEKLIKLLDNSSVTAFDYDNGPYKIKICRESTLSENTKLSNTNSSNTANAESSATLTPDVAIDDIFIIKSPLVGTFHNYHEDKTKPLIKIGDFIKKNQILCIIEAMKIFNTITSPIEGKVINILHKDGDIVDFDKDLIILQKVR